MHFPNTAPRTPSFLLLLHTYHHTCLKPLRLRPPCPNTPWQDGGSFSQQKTFADIENSLSELFSHFIHSGYVQISTPIIKRSFAIIQLLKRKSCSNLGNPLKEEQHHSQSAEHVLSILLMVSVRLHFSLPLPSCSRVCTVFVDFLSTPSPFTCSCSLVSLLSSQRTIMGHVFLGLWSLSSLSVCWLQGLSPPQWLLQKRGHTYLASMMLMVESLCWCWKKCVCTGTCVSVCVHRSKCLCGCTHSDMMKDLWH